MLHTNQIRVRYAETDLMGVVYHANYFLYFEEGRDSIMQAINYNLAALEKRNGIYLPVIECFSKFMKPAHYDELITVNTELTFDNRLTFTFAHTLLREKETLCTGWTKHCFINQATMLPSRPPADFVKAVTGL